MSSWANGWWAKVLYLAHRLLQKLSGGRAGLHLYVICAQPIGQGMFDMVRDDPRTVVTAIDRSDPLVSCFPRPAEVNRRRFDQNATCYVIAVKGEFAGHLWLVTGAYDEDEVRCRYELPMAPPCVWDFDVYIEPRFRNGRAMARLWKAVTADLRRQGVGWSYSRISLFNAQSIQAHERLGAVPVATAAFVVLGSLQFTVYSPVPNVHLQVTSTRRPHLRLPLPLPLPARQRSAAEHGGVAARADGRTE